MKKVWFSPAFLFLIAAVCLHAQSDEKTTEKKSYITQRVRLQAPVIDGKEDSAWAQVPWEGGFIQREPDEGKEPTQQTAFKILYDDRNMYALIRAFDTEPEKIDCRMCRRDNTEGDIVGIQLDSYFDHRTAFTYLVNAGEVKFDGVFTNDGENEDYSPDPVWYVSTTRDSAGWMAEMRIPLNQLRFGKKKEHVWGLQVARYLFRRQELSLWQHIPKDATGWVHSFGELNGISGIVPSRRIELLPYVMGGVQTQEKIEGDSFRRNAQHHFQAGLDSKIGLTSDLTMDLTVNPDFGQVEADPSVVNLTAFETFYEEKRPFFIEGANIMDYQIMMGDGDFSRDNLFYSRRIGKPASYTPELAEEEHVRMPSNSSILGALKVTGKTKNGLSIGVMEALTSREKALIDLDGNRREISVEPMTNYFLGRMQQDYSEGATTVGGMLTNSTRFIQDEHLQFLRRMATTGGVDFLHQWKDRTYYIDFNAVFSTVTGHQDAILATQLSPVRYFQRPDVDHVHVDSSRTSIAGHGGSLVFGKQGNGHINFAVGTTWRSPGLELNDMGYLRRADAIMEFVWAAYRYWTPFAIFRELQINFNQWRGWDFDATNIFDGGNINMWFMFKNYWNFSQGFGLQGEGLSASELRGGPMLLYPPSVNYWASVSTDERKPFSFELNGYGSWSRGGSSNYEVQPEVNWRASNHFSLSMGPSFNLNMDKLQYMTTLSFGNETRYIFGKIDQKTLGLVLRFTLNLTPSLTIQYYGQPFISAGKYSEIKRITDPRAERYVDRFHLFSGDEIHFVADSALYHIDENADGAADYSVGSQDFNFKQFRSNLVIRWEYTPGSTLYLVWSQDRTGVSPEGSFAFGPDMKDLFSIHPNNIFLVKINKWFSL